MAQHFSVPLAFEFLPGHHKWHVVDFAIVGREQDFKPAPAKFPGTDILIPAIGIPAPQVSNDVLIRFKTDLNLDFFSSERAYTAWGIEEAAFLEALAELRDKGRAIPAGMDQMLVSEGKEPAPSRRRLDPWIMRDEFLKLEETPSALANFLNRWGTWTTFSLFGRSITGHEAIRLLSGQEQPRFLLPLTVWRQRNEYRTGILGPPSTWLSTRAQLGVTHQRPQFPYLGITARTCPHAIETTITLDHLRKLKSRICARVDCDNIFPVDSEHGKVYCEQYCGHLVSVRKKRAAAKRAAKGTKRKKA